MTGKEKLTKALNHEEAPLLIDIGATPTTGIHCSMVEKMRAYYGLEKRPVVVSEPMQMLGLVEDDLKQAMGIQTIGVTGEKNIFGFGQDHLKEFRTPWGQEVLVPGDFNTDIAPNGDVLLYAQGNRAYPPAARMPASGFFFDAIDRADEFDEDEYNVEDNFEEFGPVSEDGLAWLKTVRERYLGSADAVVGNLGGTAFGDIAMVPGPSLLAPKGIRNVEEWYVSTVVRPETLREIFDYELKWALENLQKMHATLGDTIQVAYVCGNDLARRKRRFARWRPSDPSTRRITKRSTTGFTRIPTGKPSSIPAAVFAR